MAREGYLGSANGFPLMAIQNNLAPEFQHDQRKQVIGVIHSLSGMIGNQMLYRRPLE